MNLFIVKLQESDCQSHNKQDGKFAIGDNFVKKYKWYCREVVPYVIGPVHCPGALKPKSMYKAPSVLDD